MRAVIAKTDAMILLSVGVGKVEIFHRCMQPVMFRRSPSFEDLISIMDMLNVCVIKNCVSNHRKLSS